MVETNLASLLGDTVFTLPVYLIIGGGEAEAVGEIEISAGELNIGVQITAAPDDPTDLHVTTSDPLADRLADLLEATAARLRKEGITDHGEADTP